MAYSDFDFDIIEEKFGIRSQFSDLFSTIDSVQPTDYLKTALNRNKKLHSTNEKAKSEAIVFPVLLEIAELNTEFLTIYSGENLKADITLGLNGECDFILARNSNSILINYPILQVIEAKKGDIDLGLPQCAAQLIGARILNQKRGVTLPALYGCVTNSRDWQFLKLETEISVDTRLYTLDRLPELLGVFQHIVDQYKVWMD